MNKLTQISIPEPCTQLWDDMTAMDNGRHCEHCQKIVIDFTVMTNQQIIDYLSGNNKACGKFSSSQIAHINNQLTYSGDLQQVSFFKKSMVFVSLVLATYYAKAQTAVVKPRTEQTPNVLTLGKVVTSQDTTTYHTVTGKVIDEAGLPINGARIKSGDGRVNAVADSNGFYQINLPTNIKMLTVSAVGYSEMLIVVDKSLGNNFNAILKPINFKCIESVLVGGIVVKKAPFYKRWYYRFIKKPIKSIFG